MLIAIPFPLLFLYGLFLTNEEQDVNREIQHIEVDIGEITKSIGEYIFNSIYTEKKYRYNAKYSFDFNKMIDDRSLSGYSAHIGVRVITPYFEGSGLDDYNLRTLSSREKNLILGLPQDTSALDEMEDILKIQQYLYKKAGSSSSDVIDEIKSRKSREVRDRKERLESLLIEGLKDADFYVNAQKLDLKNISPEEKINSGLRLLVDSYYFKLKYVTEFIDSQKELQDLLVIKNTELQIDGEEKVVNKLALGELREYMEIRTLQHAPITMKAVLDNFTSLPYGWLPIDIIGLIIRLQLSQEINLQMSGDYLNASDSFFIEHMTKKQHRDRILIKQRKKISHRSIQKAKKMLKEVFSYNASFNDEDALISSLKEYSEQELESIESMLNFYESSKYPGEEVLLSGKAAFESMIGTKDAVVFFENLLSLEDKLLDYADCVGEVKGFFKNQKESFDNAVKQLGTYKKNKAYVLDNEIIEAIEKIEGIITSERPYSQIHQLPHLVDVFIKKYMESLSLECQPISDTIKQDWEKVKSELSKHDFKDKLFSKFENRFNNLLERLDTTSNFFEAVAMKEESYREKERCFKEIEKIAIPHTPVVKKMIMLNTSSLFHEVRIIKTPKDIDRVVDEVRHKLTTELKEDTEIRLI